MEAAATLSPRGIRAGAENHTAVARPASPKSRAYGTRPMLVTSAVDVQGAAARRALRVSTPRIPTGSSRAVNRLAPGPSGAPWEDLSARVRPAVVRSSRTTAAGSGRSPSSRSVSRGSSEAMPTSTSRVPFPIGISLPRGRSSTGMVIRTGPAGRPRETFQRPTISDTATSSWSLTVQGGVPPVGAARRGTGSSACSMPLPTAPARTGSGRESGATRTGRAQTARPVPPAAPGG